MMKDNTKYKIQIPLFMLFFVFAWFFTLYMAHKFSRMDFCRHDDYCRHYIEELRLIIPGFMFNVAFGIIIWRRVLVIIWRKIRANSK